MSLFIKRLSLIAVSLLLSFSDPLLLKSTSIQAIASEQSNSLPDSSQATGVKLYNESLGLYQQGKYQQALEKLQTALVIFQKNGDAYSQSGTLHQIGIVYYSQRQYKQALDYYQQAFAIKNIDDNARSIILTSLAEVYNELDDNNKALDFYQQALLLSKKANNPVQESKILNNIAVTYNYQNQHVKALSYFQQSLTIRRKLGDKKLITVTVSNIGKVYLDLSDYFKASQFLKESIQISQEIGDKNSQLISLISLGSVYNSTGEYGKAIDIYQQASVINKEVGDKNIESSLINNYAGVYRNLGEYDKSLKLYQQSLTLLNQLGIKSKIAITTNNIGAVYSKQNNYPKALEFYNQALIIARQLNDKGFEATVLNNIGQIYDSLDDSKKALDNYLPSLAIIKEIGDKSRESATINNIGEVYRGLKQYPKALNYYAQALKIAREIGDKPTEGLILSNISNLLLETNKNKEAIEKLKESIKIWESLRPGLSDINKVSLQDTQAKDYRSLQEALIAEKQITQALEISERGRARAFVELLAKRLSNQENTILNKINSPNFSEIQRIAKEQKATLVQYSIIRDKNTSSSVSLINKKYPEKLFIWVIKKTGEITFRQVDITKVINQNIKSDNTKFDNIIGAIRNKLSSTRGLTNRERQQQQLLNEILISPISDLLPSNPQERVVFIPQDTLLLLPFAALQDKNGKYLIQKHTILMAPAIQVLDLTHKYKREKPTKPEDFLIVGNPTMPTVSLPANSPPEQLIPLPGAEKEAKDIAKLFNAKALIGNQATKAFVLDKMPQAKLIHLATHGLIGDFKELGIPGAIALAPNSIKANKSEPGDGLLTASEILDLKLNANLVVLSACDTGQGRVSGDGVIGLSRSLISAGASSVLVSLWAVSDEATAFLMTEFYRNLRINPDKAIALRQAMLTTMKSYPNTQEWAPFTFIGEAD